MYMHICICVYIHKYIHINTTCNLFPPKPVILKVKAIIRGAQSRSTRTTQQQPEDTSRWPIHPTTVVIMQSLWNAGLFYAIRELVWGSE